MSPNWSSQTYPSLLRRGHTGQSDNHLFLLPHLPHRPQNPAPTPFLPPPPNYPSSLEFEIPSPPSDFPSIPHIFTLESLL